VYWLARPPILRYVAAVAVLLVAVVWDLWPEAVVRHPFAATRVPAGAPFEGAIEWRTVPDGLLPEVEPVGVAMVDLAAGEPVLPSHVGRAPVPDGWWVVSLEVPSGVRVGAEVRVAVTSPGSSEAALIRGIVVAGTPDGVGATGGVAVPEAEAALVAAAASGGRVAVLAGSG
jgi:hypothetical protein